MPVAGRPVAVVQHIVHHRSMSEPDTIKEGWSVTRLWHLWYAFVVGSVFISVILALILGFQKSMLTNRCRQQPLPLPVAIDL